MKGSTQTLDFEKSLYIWRNCRDGRRGPCSVAKGISKESFTQSNVGIRLCSCRAAQGIDATQFVLFCLRKWVQASFVGSKGILRPFVPNASTVTYVVSPSFK